MSSKDPRAGQNPPDGVDPWDAPAPARRPREPKVTPVPERAVPSSDSARPVQRAPTSAAPTSSSGETYDAPAAPRRTDPPPVPRSTVPPAVGRAESLFPSLAPIGEPPPHWDPPTSPGFMLAKLGLPPRRKSAPFEGRGTADPPTHPSASAQAVRSMSRPALAPTMPPSEPSEPPRVARTVPPERVGPAGGPPERVGPAGGGPLSASPAGHSISPHGAPPLPPRATGTDRPRIATPAPIPSRVIVTPTVAAPVQTRHLRDPVDDDDAPPGSTFPVFAVVIGAAMLLLLVVIGAFVVLALWSAPASASDAVGRGAPAPATLTGAAVFPEPAVLSVVPAPAAALTPTGATIGRAPTSPAPQPRFSTQAAPPSEGDPEPATLRTSSNHRPPVASTGPEVVEPHQLTVPLPEGRPGNPPAVRPRPAVPAPQPVWGATK